jgi:hypothetical protein
MQAHTDMRRHRKPGPLAESHGRNEFQGYHFAQPMSANQFEIWLENRTIGAFDALATAAAC